jgi:DNA polymerase III delta subunit
MTTFSQWWRGWNKNPNPKQVTWLCGTERVLVDEVLLSIRRALMPDSWNYVPLAAGDDSERTIWSEIFMLQQGIDTTRLVVVRNAERLKAPDRLVEFAKRKDSHPGVFLVLVSSDAEVPRAEPVGDARRGEVLPWLVKSKAAVIECKPFTQDTAKTAVEWVVARTHMRAVVAAHLLTRADGNMRLVRDACVKLAVFHGEITVSAINDLLSAQPRDTFVDALIAMDKPEALKALARLPEDDYSRALGMLDSQLDLVGMIHDMQTEHAPLHEIARKAGSRGFLVKGLLTAASHYDVKRRVLIRRALTLSDSVLRAGEKVGVMEALVALW